MPEPLKGTSRYMAGIDGLRAFAVLAVILYHLNYNWAPGGLLGVGIFFVLSGYLITDLLIAQWSKHERLDMKDFWLRRARRLLPALLILLVLVVAWVMLFKPAHLPSMKGDVPAAILYVSNWWLIFQDVSYFEKFGPASPFGHLWSLAVEEQFYLFWPLLLAIGLRFVKRRGPLVCMTLAAAAFSAISMAWMYEPGLDPSRVYYGTDTRVFALLIGAALAMVWPSRKLSANISRSARLSLDLAGVAGLSILLFAIWKTNQYDDFLYRGGLVLLSVVSAVVVATLAHPASRLARWMGCKPLKWLGVRSYGIYLWHYPVIVLTNPVGAEQADAFSIPRAILQVTACIVLAALSWKYIEEPIRHGALGRIWSSLRLQRNGQKKRYTRLVASTCALVLCVTYYGVASLTSDATASQTSADEKKAEVPKPVAPHTVVLPKQVGPTLPAGSVSEQGKPAIKPSEATKKTDSATQTKPGKKPVPPKETTPATVPTTSTEPVNDNTNPTETTAKDQAGQQDAVNDKQDQPVQSGKGITALGDSVMLDVAPYLEKLLPGIMIDAKIGRQMSQAPDVIANLKANGHLGKIVVIELGTNGSFSEKQLLKLLKSLDSADHIILVNTRVPKPWESVVNTTLAQVAATYPQTILLDWYAASAGKDSFFYKDGVHLNPEGSEYYADFLAKAIVNVSNEKKE
ncbi:acyltransferase family protein [Brevibacillus choshinensis]|uniref:acyltransferase family protein n=1 Tax=Brevibacillus choshinensis TaxID=54911 RepID=UPI002E21F43D|nr:acyltransferase family protein [Brevibacillus choshinensis]